MGLDSVELIIATEETFGVSISDAEAEQIITPRHLINHIKGLVNARPKCRPCLSQRAFHRVRRSLVTAAQVDRSSISLSTKISQLFPKPQRVNSWQSFRQVSGLTDLPDLRFGRGVIFAPTRVRCLVSQEVTRMAGELSHLGDWAESEVRTVVRMIISEQLGIKRFSDDDEFIRDLGID